MRSLSKLFEHKRAYSFIAAIFVIILLPLIVIVASNPDPQDTRSRADEILVDQEEEGNAFIESTEESTVSDQDLAAPEPAAKLNSFAPNTKLSKEVYGYIPYWQLSNNPDVYTQYQYLTTLAYHGLPLQPTGTFNKTKSSYKIWRAQTEKGKVLRAVLVNAHNAGVKIHPDVVLFGGSRVNELLASSDNRKRAIESIMDELKNSGNPVNGVNIDFEPVPKASRENFVIFIRDLRAEMDKVDPTWEIVIDTYASIGPNSGWDLQALSPYTNAFFIMAYHFGGPGTSNFAGSRNPYQQLSNTADRYLARTTGDKIIMGFPLYTSGYGTKDDTLRSENLKKDGGGQVINRNAQREALAYGLRYDEQEKSAWYSYWVCSEGGHYRQVYFDNQRALNDKFALVNSKGLKGAGFWVQNYDSGTMDTWNAIYESFGNKSMLSAPTPKPGFVPITPAPPNTSCPQPSGSPTTSPSPTVSPTGITLNLTLGLDGIGNTGDFTNRNTFFGNTKPRDEFKTQNASVCIYRDGQNDLDFCPNPRTGELKYNEQKGLFEGSVNFPNANAGTFSIKVKVDRYLVRKVGSDHQKPLWSLVKGGNEIGTTTQHSNLMVGDVNEPPDNKLDSVDWTVIKDCLNFNPNSSTSCKNSSRADLNADGRVDQADMNYFLREFNTGDGSQLGDPLPSPSPTPSPSNSPTPSPSISPSPSPSQPPIACPGTDQGLAAYHIKVTGVSSCAKRQTILRAVDETYKFAKFKNAIGNEVLEIRNRNEDNDIFALARNKNLIVLYGLETRSNNNTWQFAITHELGHIAYLRKASYLNNYLYADLKKQEPNCYRNTTKGDVIKSYPIVPTNAKSESFAESVALFVWDKSGFRPNAFSSFKTQCPKNYKWFDDNIL